MIVYTTSTSDSDLEGILLLQKKNLPRSLTREEMISQGFVTVNHRFEDLQKMNVIEQHIIARDETNVVAYLLSMTKHSKADIPVLIPMFDAFEQITFNTRKLSTYNFIVVGQVCVDKAYRGQGILDKCYRLYIETFKDKYDFAVTEIATANLRSMRAHKRIGFETIHEYIAPDNEHWSIVVLPWERS